MIYSFLWSDPAMSSELYGESGCGDPFLYVNGDDRFFTNCRSNALCYYCQAVVEVKHRSDLCICINLSQ